MGKYSCEKCAKTFSQKSHYDKHLTRKNPCEIQTDKIKALIDKAVEEKWIELNKKLISNNTENNITINITEQMDISKMSNLELLEKCKELGITKCSSKNKSQLIELINGKNKVVEKTPTSNTPSQLSLFISGKSDQTFPIFSMIWSRSINRCVLSLATVIIMCMPSLVNDSAGFSSSFTRLTVSFSIT